MKTYNNLYGEIISLKNLISAWRGARKGKTKLKYVKEFEEHLVYNLKILHDELKNQSYKPSPLKTFLLRDPKTRKISKSDFRDRIVHHALIRIIEPIFDKTFIYDSCANRIGKGTLFALQRFEKFQRKVTHNFSKEAFCLKADITHYFQEIDRNILLNIIKKKIACEKTLGIINLVLRNFENNKGMPLGNLTSQFFANVYLNELDIFIKHNLKAKFYIRYVDDFVILHKSKLQLENWKIKIDNFLIKHFGMQLHKDKSKIRNLSGGIDFVGFRNFYYFRILRKRNAQNFESKIKLFNKGKITNEKFFKIFLGWRAYALWGDNYNLIRKFNKEIKII